MNMNIQTDNEKINNKNSVTTLDEYLELLKKESLSPIEMIEKKRFETFISNCQKYEEFISPAAQSILNTYNSSVLSLVNKNHKSKQEEEVLDRFQTSMEDNQKQISQNGPVRKLAKAGYIDATIILVALLNIGFIVAMFMLAK